jgi:hypothetical protein
MRGDQNLRLVYAESISPENYDVNALLSMDDHECYAPDVFLEAACLHNLSEVVT